MLAGFLTICCLELVAIIFLAIGLYHSGRNNEALSDENDGLRTINADLTRMLAARVDWDKEHEEASYEL